MNLKTVAAMKKCEYATNFIDATVEVNEYNFNTWKPLLRQTMINLGVCCAYFLLGIFFGAPTVIIAQMRKDVNSTAIVTDEMLSWLTSTISISSVPFVIILPFLFNLLGRKVTFFGVWLLLLIGFIIFYTSTNIYYLVFSEIFAGVCCASALTIGPVLIAEYTSPQYRGIFLTLKSASVFWGMWVSNAIGTLCHWKNIALVGFVCSVYLITVMMWPESPYWLAIKGRYADSAKSHRWLRGVNENSEKELKQLITFHKKLYNVPIPSSRDNGIFFSLWLTITSGAFYKPVIISLALFSHSYFTGKFVISMYAIDVLRRLTEHESIVYKAMLILDGVTVFSTYIGCVASRYFKRRTLLLVFSSIVICLLYLLSLYSYLVFLSVIDENHVVVLLLLSAYSVVVACGPMILPTSIYGEIIPIRHQRLSLVFVGSGSVTILSSLLKFSPVMFKTFKMHGCFLFFAITSNVLLAVLYFYLPETKDKTIQEIEQYFTEENLLLETSNSLTLQKNQVN